MPQKKSSWSKTGKTNLKKKQGFNWKKYAPFIAIVTLVGGFFVWRSFATTKLYDYQYSVYQCSGFNKEKINPSDGCVQKSAEAMTYRYYKTALNKDLNKQDDAKGYAYWTQKFAGDRVQPTDVGNKFIAASKTASVKTNQAFVEGVYSGALGKKVDASSLKYWKTQLDSKKWSKGKVLAHFASQDAAIKANQAAFANYLSKADPVKIVENAKKDRDVRLLKSTSNANEAEKVFNSIKSYPNTANTAVSAAKASAGKSAPGLNDLKAIAANEKTVRDLAVKTNSPRNKLAEYERLNQVTYERAKAVSDYSPDVSADGIKKQYDRTMVFAKSASNVNKKLQVLISEIAGYYKTAAGRYEASQKPVSTGIASRPGDTDTSVPAAPPNTTGQDFQKYMIAACARKTGTKAYSVGHGTAYRNVTYRYAGQGNSCTVDKLGSYVSGAIYCDATYAPISYTNPAKGCQKVAADKGRQCPSGYFANNGSCWSNKWQSVPHGQSCAAKYAGYTYYKTFTSALVGHELRNECRIKKPQYAGY